MTSKPCWRPTRFASRAKRWHSWWPRTVTRPATPLELIDVEYEILEPVVDARRALAADAPVIRDDLEGKDEQSLLRLGDRRRGRHRTPSSQSAEVVVSEDIVYPRVHPAPMETCGCVADYDRVNGKLTLWTTSQAPHAHRTVYALVSGLPEHKIRVISPDIGGGFGNKVPIYPGYVCAIVASLVLNKPVKWMEDRSENLISTGFARDYIMRGEIAATRDGKILAIRSQRARRPRRVQRHGGTGQVSRPASSGSSPAATTSRPHTAR